MLRAHKYENDEKTKHMKNDIVNKMRKTNKQKNGNRDQCMSVILHNDIPPFTIQICA